MDTDAYINAIGCLNFAANYSKIRISMINNDDVVKANLVVDFLKSGLELETLKIKTKEKHSIPESSINVALLALAGELRNNSNIASVTLSNRI